MVFILARTIVYASLFVGFFLVFLPARVLVATGISPWMSWGPTQIAGAMVTAAGALLALWCVLTFALIGQGTPAPFDPPRRLVTAGPYATVRNPMYIGAVLALAGAALVYQSVGLLLYAIAFLVVAALFVAGVEEPMLRGMFGTEYEIYCAIVPRWFPRIPGNERKQSGLHYVPATNADKAYFAALNEACYTDVVTRQFGSWDADAQRAYFDNKWLSQQFRKIVVDGEVVGGIWIEERDDHRLLREIQVHPQFQGQGIGTRVVREAIAAAVADGRKLRLHVLFENRARSLYERLGFVVIGENDTQYIMQYRDPEERS